MSAESLEANTSHPHIPNIPRESVLFKIIGSPIKPAVGLIRQLYYRIDAYPLYALNIGLFLGGLGSPIDVPFKLGLGAILGVVTLSEWLGYENPISPFVPATHFMVNRTHYHGLRSRCLSTGEKVSPGQLVGGIHFIYNIPQLTDNRMR